MDRVGSALNREGLFLYKKKYVLRGRSHEGGA